jgi:hypothetical protein
MTALSSGSPDNSGLPTTPLSEEQFQEHLRARNADTLADLERQLRSSLGVIPFVGAGISASVALVGNVSRFPQWGELLKGLASGSSIEAEVNALLENGDYEAAASKVFENRPAVLSRRIRDAFDRQVAASSLINGTVSYIPYLAAGPVITTNFDHVLEQAFAAAGREFRTVISGPLPDATIAAIHGNDRALLKIHGDCRDRTFRVLTLGEYEDAYGVRQAGSAATAQAQIGNLAWILFTNRPLLFLGCSLQTDRTVRVLRAIQERLPGLTHYAILAADRSFQRWQARERQLDELGVRPVWFTPGQFHEVENLLAEILERSSTRPIAPHPAAHGAARATAGAPPITMSGVTALLRPDYQDTRGDAHASDVRSIVRALLDGRLAFFLGAYAALDPSLLGNTFYNELAERFGCPMLAGDRTAVAAFISNRHV